MADDRTIPQQAKGSTVTFTLKIDGTAVPRSFEIYALTVVKEVNRIPFAKMTLIDGDPAKENFPASNDKLFIPGGEIEIYAGHQSQEDLLFKGIILKHAIAARRNGSSQLRIECRDKAYKMTLIRKSRYFMGAKDSDLATQVVQPYGLQASFEDTKVKHTALVQYDSTDWDFLINRMDLHGKLVIVNDGSLKAAAADFSSTPVLTLQYGATIHELDAEMDARNQYAGVLAEGWSHTDQKLVEVKAAEPSSVKVPGNLTASDLAKVNGSDPRVLRHSGFPDTGDLQAWADAYWAKSRMAKIRGRVQFDGFAKLKPGDLIELKGLGDRFNGRIWVAGLRHDVSQGGWTTEVQFGPDPEWFLAQVQESTSISPWGSVTGLHTGVVVKLEGDPLSEGRILIKLPLVSLKDEGVWARIATLDAGKDRGSFFRPDKDDEVLVGFLNNDPSQAVIVGMLHSSKHPEPIQAKNDNKEKGFFFTSKMKVLFHEGDKSMEFLTPGKNKLVISDKEKGITLEDQNGNKIVMNKDGITLESSKKLVVKASSGDIEIEGQNIKNKAQMEFKAEGSAGLEVSSSAIAKLKGSLVQIN